MFLRALSLAACTLSWRRLKCTCLLDFLEMTSRKCFVFRAVLGTAVDTFICQSAEAFESGHRFPRESELRILRLWVCFWGPVHRCTAGRSCPQGHGPRNWMHLSAWMDRHPFLYAHVRTTTTRTTTTTTTTTQTSQLKVALCCGDLSLLTQGGAMDGARVSGAAMRRRERRLRS